MGYPEEILTDTPEAYYRLDMVGAATNGDLIPETVADLEAELVFEPLSGVGPSPEPYGFDSPIETDIASREFRSWANSASEGFLGTSRIRRVASAEFQPTGDAAIEAWIRPEQGMYAAVDIPLVGTDDFGIQYHHDGSQRISGYCVDSAATRWVVVDTSFDFSNYFGESFHVVVVRVGNTLALYIQGTLRGTTTITSGLATRTSGGDFFIGHDSPLHFHRERIDEVAFYSHSITGTRVLVHFEAAINANLLNGFSNVIPSAILYSDLEPDPISFPFRHNWTQNLIERIGFLSGLSTARSGVEESNGARIKPRREVELTHVIRDNDERQQLRALLKVNQNRKWFIPILEHREFLSALLSSGATTIPADTLLKDYEVGGYFELRELNADQQIVNSEVLQIASFTATEIVPTTPTQNDYPALVSQVGPARRGLLSGSISPQGHTDAVEEVQLLARLIAEDEKVTPNRITPWTPTITYKSHEVYDPQEWQSNDWSDLREYGIDRTIEDQDFDTGIFEVESDTTEASESFSWRVKLKGIDKIAAFLGWFYYHAGSLVYLWVPSMQRDLTIVGAAGSDLTVSKHIYTDNFAGSQTRRNLAFVYNDNSMILREIDSSTTSGANDVLTLNTAVPTQTNLRSVSYLKFCRIEADTLEKALAVDDVMLATWRFRELLYSPD